jgi:hypothetical protein
MKTKGMLCSLQIFPSKLSITNSIPRCINPIIKKLSNFLCNRYACPSWQRMWKMSSQIFMRLCFLVQNVYNQKWKRWNHKGESRIWASRCESKKVANICESKGPICWGQNPIHRQSLQGKV